jgi:hypothetical protein
VNEEHLSVGNLLLVLFDMDPNVLQQDHELEINVPPRAKGDFTRRLGLLFPDQIRLRLSIAMMNGTAAIIQSVSTTVKTAATET